MANVLGSSQNEYGFIRNSLVAVVVYFLGVRGHFSVSNATGGVNVNVMLKRAYESPAETDGQRIIVDRLWPRGVAKAKAGIDLWLKEVAPSTELRKWFAHDPDKWAEFKTRYRAELKGNGALVELKALARQGDITLICGARDQLNNEAVVLKQILDRAS